MDTTSAVALTSVVVATGQWSKKDGHITIKLVVGGMVLAIMLSAMAASNQELADKFATLILVGALLTYAIPITQKLGFSK